MKAFITKYALTEGIFAIEAKLSNDFDMMIEDVHKSNVCYRGKDWHSTREEAEQRAEQMRQAKIKSLLKQIDKLKALSFK